MTAALAEFKAALDAGQAPEIDGFCERHAECGPELRERLEELAHGAGRIGHFRLLTRLGQGGMGTVHLAYDEKLGRKVALKQIKPEHLHVPRVRARFELEARAVSRLNHPNLCSLFEAGRDGGVPYLVMQYVEGQTLRSRIEKARESETAFLGMRGEETPATSSGPATHAAVMAVAQLGEKIADALHHAHENGLVHRDIKPGNIMVRDDGAPVVLDFGLVREEEAVDRTLTVSGEQPGTPMYMAPEQIVPAGRAVDRRTDVYGLGATLYESLTFSPAFDASTSHELFQKILREPPRDAGNINRQIPRDLRVVVETAMEKDPDRRYQTALELAEELRRVRSFEPIRARRAGVLSRAWRWTRRNPAAALALVTLVSATVAFAFENDRARRSVRLASARADAIDERQTRFDTLATVVHIEDSGQRARELHPAWPEHSAKMREWLEVDAVRMREARVQIRETLDRLRAATPPRTEGEREASRRQHARYGELQGLRSKLHALARAQSVRDGEAEPDRVEVETGLGDKSGVVLKELAWPLVRLEREVFGREAEGLALARLADARMRGGPGSALPLLACALFANGLDAEALATAAEAVVVAAPEVRPRYRETLHELERAVAAARGASGHAAIARVARQVADLEGALVSWEWGSKADRFLHDTLASTLPAVEAFEHDVAAGVRRRLGWADRVEGLTLRHPNARFTWAEAAAAIRKADGVVASGSYAKHPIHDLQPQIGLVPIGMNPRTKLWEFYHLRSAWDPESELDPADLAIPLHRGDGSIEVTEDTGVVFVLLPGGTFWVGAQLHEPGKPNYAPHAAANEIPVHEVTLEPFFVARHELTQGQWKRLRGGDRPSYYTPGAYSVDLTHPVEQVTWEVCTELMESQGLLLPTEAQWEYGCRAGTTTPWWTGWGRESLIRDGMAANLQDQAAARVAPQWKSALEWPELDDGFPVHAPVGAMRPNPWGLYHVHGNVWEWCRDGYGEYGLAVRPGDGLREVKASSSRTYRGGGFANGALSARSATRDKNLRNYRGFQVGLRAARALLPGR